MDAPIAQEAPEPPVLSSSRGTETILIVEDEDAVRRFVGRILVSHGYRVLEAATPEAAVAICQGREGIDLMIADVVLPQMNGHELAKRVAPLCPRMKRIFMSGYTEQAVTRRSLLEPGEVILEKPIGRETMLRKVRDVLDAPRRESKGLRS